MLWFQLNPNTHCCFLFGETILMMRGRSALQMDEIIGNERPCKHKYVSEMWHPKASIIHTNQAPTLSVDLMYGYGMGWVLVWVYGDPETGQNGII